MDKIIPCCNGFAQKPKPSPQITIDRTELPPNAYNLLTPKDSDFAISRLHYRNGEEGYAPSETLGAECVDLN
jgi:hypothetical protein